MCSLGLGETISSVLCLRVLTFCSCLGLRISWQHWTIWVFRRVDYFFYWSSSALSEGLIPFESSLFFTDSAILLQQFLSPKSKVSLSTYFDSCLVFSSISISSIIMALNRSRFFTLCTGCSFLNLSVNEQASLPVSDFPLQQILERRIIKFSTQHRVLYSFSSGLTDLVRVDRYW